MAFNFHLSKGHHTCRVKIPGNKSWQNRPRIRGDHMRHSTLQTELTQSWLLVLMPVTESEVGKINIMETQMMTRLWWFSWDLEQDPALPNGICFTLQVLPNLSSPHSWVLECCAPWHISAPPWSLGISASAPCPAPQPRSHNQMHLFTNTTQQIKVLPAPSALPQWIREMQLQTLAAAPFFPRGDGALLDMFGFSGLLPALLSGLPFNMLHLADWWWHPSPSVLVGLWRQALGCPSSHCLPRASRSTACYSLLIFQ